MRGIGTLCALAAPAAALLASGPFTTSGRWILAGDNKTNVNLAGINWPGAGEAMIPEGLQYQSAAVIAARIKSLGMNVVRLTYATEMVDQIFANGGADVTVQKSLIAALGQQNGTTVWEMVKNSNPQFDDTITRLQAFDTVASELAKQQIYVLVDNHVSKAQWCCSPLDGNSWWGDTYFSTANWTRGLTYMTEHTRDWPNLIGLSLRNELRQPLTNITLYQQAYNWETWYARTREGAAAIHKANPDALVFLSGLDSDTTLQPVVEGSNLTPGKAMFSPGDYFDGAKSKLVLELHSYANIINERLAKNCTGLRESLVQGGWSAMSTAASPGGGANNVKNRLPTLMTEFGWGQNDQEWNSTYATCIQDFLRDDVRAGWMIWAISGSYYVREGRQDFDEPWGILNHDWSDWRSQKHAMGELKRLVNSTLSITMTGDSDPNPSSGSGSGNNSPGKKNASGSIKGSVYNCVWGIAALTIFNMF
ncbi:hypothetical protein PgNI_11342 [Pyricularia grisea]|uniref:Glycoside hydrolase family 5 domain-containing protein n=1 Tax=Pyricularia grisea TaxID=148305 RepID=A0A6P8APS6_PYRGI|nr:hypothetical protein PgNI_11342 [Pyricularia grisea]TLD04032.1 hypothetical protein PgNI_11342 [Pyricularia grisea]